MMVVWDQLMEQEATTAGECTPSLNRPNMGIDQGRPQSLTALSSSHPSHTHIVRKQGSEQSPSQPNYIV